MSKIVSSLCFKEVLFDGQSYSQSQVEQKYREFAAILSEKQNGSPFVFLLARNDLATLVSFLAIRSLGLVCVMIDPQVGTIELDEYRQMLQPSCIIDHKHASHDLCDDEISSFDYPSLKPIDTLMLHDACVLMFSSAEDGWMKPVVITEDNILSDIFRGALYADPIDNLRTSCALLPFYHIFGLISGLIVPLVTGGRCLVVDISNLSRIDALANDIEKHGVTNIYSIPLVYLLLCKVPQLEQKFKAVVSLYSGAYKLPQDLFDKFLSKSGKQINEGYGMTESTGISVVHCRNSHTDASSLGDVLPVNSLRIVNEHGQDLAPGTTGEILLRGDNVSRGYYGNPEATARHFAGGWLHTGDLGHVDELGRVFFDGLRKRMLNVAGKNVYPAEVERLISIHPNVKTVRVDGQPNGIFGDKLEAYISLINHSDEAQRELLDWCSASVSKFKIPKLIHFSTQG